jgi:hypothetical protein
MAIPSILTIGESGTGSALRIIVRLVRRQRVERDFSNTVSYSRQPRIDLCCAGVVPFKAATIARMEIQYRLGLD